MNSHDVIPRIVSNLSSNGTHSTTLFLSKQILCLCLTLLSLKKKATLITIS